ncbi:MAG: alpha/beta hydrolase [Marinibacterium sp.]|nr:alpha/beta hydrolase [Marinibacterium sp.]
MIRINAIGDSPVLHGSTRALGRELRRKGAGSGPAIIMIHGYKYLPGHPDHCPHGLIMALHPKDVPHRPPSWPRQLGFGVGHHDEGLAIAFGWQARGHLWQAKASAAAAGRALARVIAALRADRPERAVHVVAHSMGSELAFEALHLLPTRSVDRIITMTGASYRSRALAALASPAGQTVEVINVTSRENDAFDFLFETLIPPPEPGDRAIGHGLRAPNAVTLQIDSPRTLALLDSIGTPIAPPDRRICHWSSYTRPGVLRAYNALMRRPDLYPLALLQQGLPPQPDPRWSRLMPALPVLRPLPFQQNAS